MKFNFLKNLFHRCNFRWEVIYGYCQYGLGTYEVKMCRCGKLDDEIINFKEDKTYVENK